MHIFKEFEDKLECVRDMLEEFVEASAAFTSPVPPPSSDGTFYEGESSGNLTRRNPPLQALRDIIQKELEARRTAVAARKAAVEAEERLVREKAAARISTSPGGTGGGAGKSAMGIAEQQHTSTSNAHSSATERASVVRQHQLEKMVKALVARQEKVRIYFFVSMSAYYAFIIDLFMFFVCLFFLSRMRRSRRRMNCLTSTFVSSTSSRRIILASK